MGGDWNTVWDNGSIESNIDIYNMQRIPNKCNRDLLRDMAMRFSLLDPTRVLYPDRKLYTYTPFGSQRLNRSRLDFFVVTGELIASLKECKPSNSTAINLFDHKTVTLTLGMSVPPNEKPIPRLRNCILDNLLLKYSVTLAAYKCYSFGIKTEPENVVPNPAKEIVENIVNSTRLVSNKLSEISKLMESTAGKEETPLNAMLLYALFAETDMIFADLLTLENLSLLAKKQTALCFLKRSRNRRS